MKFSAVIILFVTTIVSGAAATVADINKDIKLIDKESRKLKDLIHAFPVNGGGTIIQAHKIRKGVKKLKSGIDQGTSDVESTPPFNEADARRFLGEIEQYVSVMTDSLDDIIARKHSFQNVEGRDVVPAVKEALEDIDKSTSKFGEVLIKSTRSPKDVASEGKNLKNHLKKEFHKALEAYSN